MHVPSTRRRTDNACSVNSRLFPFLGLALPLRSAWASFPTFLLARCSPSSSSLSTSSSLSDPSGGCSASWWRNSISRVEANENSRLSFTHVSIKRTKETGHYPRPHSSLHQAIVSAADQAERVRLSEAAQACRKPSKCLLA